MNSHIRVLFKRAQSGDREAISMILKENMGLVTLIAMRYCRGFDLGDLIQHGCLGVLHAIKRFNPRKGKFSTYADYWIKNAVLRGCGKQFTVWMPVSKQPITTIEFIPLQECDDEGTLGIEHVLAAPAEDMDHAHNIRRLLKKLDPRRALVLRLHYGLDPRGPMILKDIAKLLNISQEWARKLEESAIKKLRQCAAMDI